MEVKIYSEFDELLQAVGQASQEVLGGLSGLPQTVAEFNQLVQFESESLGAIKTEQVVVRLKPSHRLLKLVAAVRAGEAKLDVSKKAGLVEPN